jgi:C1q domain
MPGVRRSVAVAVTAALVSMAGATTASAQVFGTFSWQMQPFCNIVTLTLTSVTGNFTLDGSDDQCAATKKGSASGIGVFNPDGSVGLNFTIVAPSGQPLHVSASVSPANGQGSWTDSRGRSGTFAFFGNTPGLPPLTVGDVRFRISGLTGSLPAAGGNVDVTTWSTTAYNIGGGVYTPATGAYTVPVSGTYLITTNLRWAAFAAATGRYCTAIDAPTGVAITCDTPSTDPFSIPHLSTVVFLNAGTAVKIRGFQNSGAPVNIGSSGNSDSSFAVTLLH